MVVLLSITGLSALYAYWSVVDNLRFSREKEPRRSDLASAVQGLAETLVQRSPGDKEETGLDKLELIFDEQLWDERLKKSFDEHSEFFRRWDHHRTNKV